MRPVDESFGLGIDQFGRFFAVWLAEIISGILRIVEGEMSYGGTHAKVTDHRIGLFGDFFEIVQRSGGDASVDNLFRYTASHSGGHFIHHLFGSGDLSLFREVPCGSQSPSPRYNGNLQQRIGIRQHPTDGSMARFMESDRPFLVRRNDFAFLFQSAHDTVYRIQEILFLYRLFVSAGGYQGRFVADIGYIRSGKARSLFGQEFDVESFLEFQIAQMHPENFIPFFQFRQIHIDLAVEPARPHQRFIQNIGPVGGGQNNDSGIGSETVHFGQQLVQGVLPFVIGGEARIFSSGSPDGVYFVYENDARGFLFCLAEKIPYPRGAYTHEHFHKVRTGNGEERYIRFPGYGFSQ